MLSIHWPLGWVSPVSKVLGERTLWKKRGGVQIDQEDSLVFALKIEALVNANTTTDQPPPSICKNRVDGLPQNMVPTLYYNQLYKIKRKVNVQKITFHMVPSPSPQR